MQQRTVITDAPSSTDTRVDEYVDREHWLDPSRVVSVIAGIAFAVLGAVVLLDTGLDGFPDAPTTEVWGFPQTPLLGAIDIGIGLLLLAGAADWTRGLATFVGGLMVIGGLVVGFAHDDLPAALATSAGFGWFVTMVGAVLLVLTMVMPTVGSREERVTTRMS